MNPKESKSKEEIEEILKEIQEEINITTTIAITEGKEVPQFDLKDIEKRVKEKLNIREERQKEFIVKEFLPLLVSKTKEMYDIIDKYGTKWVYTGGLFWSKEPKKTGIYCGVDKSQLSDLSFLDRISSTKYFKEHFSKEFEEFKKALKSGKKFNDIKPVLDGMTRKNYEIIAEILGENSIDENSELADSLSSYFKEDNPRFSKDRFKEAIRKHKGLRESVKESEIMAIALETDGIFIPHNTEAIMKDFDELNAESKIYGGVQLYAIDDKGNRLELAYLSDEDLIQYALGKDISQITNEDWKNYNENIDSECWAKKLYGEFDKSAQAIDYEMAVQNLKYDYSKQELKELIDKKYKLDGVALEKFMPYVSLDDIAKEVVKTDKTVDEFIEYHDIREFYKYKDIKKLKKLVDKKRKKKLEAMVKKGKPPTTEQIKKLKEMGIWTEELELKALKEKELPLKEKKEKELPFRYG